MGNKNSFYEDAVLGKTSRTIWIASACVILTALYFVAGAFSGVLNIIISLNGGSWSPYFYSSLSSSLWKYLWAVFYDWVPMTFLGLGGLYFAQTRLRERPFMKLVTSATSFRWKRLWAGVLVFIALKALMLFIQSLYQTGTDIPVWSDVDPSAGLGIKPTGLTVFRYLIIAPVLLIIISLNAFMQEVLFRGFIDQSLVRGFKQTLPAFIVSAVLFSLWHIWNYEIAFGAIPYLLGLFVFGFSMSLITAKDGGIEAAIGIHAAWNVFVVLGVGSTIITLPDTALWTMGEPGFSARTLLEELIFSTVAVLILANWRYGVERPSGSLATN